MGKGNMEKGRQVQQLPKDKVDELTAKAKSNKATSSIEKTTTATAQEISTILKHSLRWFDAPRVETDEETKDRLYSFFLTLCETGELPTVEKMALALGVTRKTLWEWEHGAKGAERARLIQQAKEMLASMDAELVNKGKIPVVSYIFRAKNYFGLRDVQEVEVSAQPNLLGDDGSREELAEKYSQELAEIPVDATEV